ncbi:DUF5801 repeats-in-toxin domain-containing protein [Halomonas sp. BC04]|uniref:DUF5801 repeats-in-toxin domain-containing protein n=1 Tax=Halomonas sp. BC04 TaxID=1403540 RepID=UPI0004BB067F|nr:DUF5801 repeats-in-toxin domain-containing protein [Halomonas sp. BC04]
MISDYALTLGEIDHGLESGGEPVVFTQDASGVITGSTADGTEVLRIEIASDGTVTVTQSAAVDHDEQGPDSLSLPTGLVGVEATVTVTDGDGDVVSDTLSADLSGSITIVDDMPSLDEDALADFDLTFSVNEAGLVENSTVSDSVNMRDAINAAGLINYGADGKQVGSLTLSLTLSEDGAASGLSALDPDSTNAGESILLRTGSNGEIEGYTASDNEVYFTLELVGDELVFTQLQAIWHDDPTGADTETLSLASGVITLEFTGTDGDGDTVNGAIDLGYAATFTIVDDVPEFGTPEDVSLGLLPGIPVVGNLDLAIGADLDGAQISSASLFSDEQGYVQVRYEEGGVETITYLTSGGKKLVFEFDVENQQLIAFKEGDNSSNPVLTIDMSVGDNQYVVSVLQPLDPVAVSFTTETIGNQGGGIDGELLISNPNLSAQFTGVGGPVNWSTNGIGVGNNLIGAGQTLIAQFNQSLTELSFEMGNTGALSWEVFSNGVSVGVGSGTTASASGGFDEIRFYGSSGGGQYNVNNFKGVFLDAELGFTLPVDVVAVDGDGDATDGSFNIGFQPGEVPPLPELPSILGLTATDVTVNEKYLEGGTAEGAGEAADSGSFTLFAPEGIDLLLIAGNKISGDGEQQGNKVKLSLADLESLAAGNAIMIETPEGNTLALTGYDAGTGEVSYSFELGGNVIHEPGEGRNELDKEGIQLELVDGLGHIAYGTIDVVVVDDIPEKNHISDVDNEIVIDDFQVTDISGTWKNAQGGSSSVVNHLVSNGTGIVWGGTNFNNGSGYKFEYASTVDIEASAVSGEPVSLGKFTHVNQPIASGTAINGVTLELTIEVMLNGVVFSIPVEVVLDHDETPNNWHPPTDPRNDDIVTIESVTITDQEVLEQLEAAGYKFDIPGFMANGKLVKVVETTETDSTSFELFASVSYVSDDLVDSEGEFEVIWGADGPADEDDPSTASPITFTGADGQEVELDADGKAEIVGEYGTLSVTVVDGKVSYEYTLSTAGREKLKADGSLEEKGLQYTLTDADGDRVTSQINFEFTAVSAPIELVNSSNDAFIDLIDQTGEPDVFMSEISATAGALGGTNTSSNDEEFHIASGQSGQVSFSVDATRSSSVSWKLFDDSGQVIEQGSRDYAGLVELQVLGEGSYRLEITASGSGGGFISGRGKAEASDIHLVTFSQVLESFPVAGNLFAEEGVFFGSNDTRLEVEKDGSLEEVMEGTTIDGQYGTLILNPDGSYSYTANPSLESLGSVEQFTYQVVNSNGDSAMATLAIRLDSNTESVVWGTDADDTLEGTAGNDIIVGGAGDDILVGGEGADTFKWNFGDQAVEGEVAARDTVVDFDTGIFGEDAEADRLSLSDLLQGATDDTIGDYITAEQSETGVLLKISSGGAGSTVDQEIMLNGVAFGEGQTGGQFIQDLLANGQLQID